MIPAAAAADAPSPAPDTLTDALLAARMCALDPLLGGMVLRGGGAARDAVLAALAAALPAAAVRRLPVTADEARLAGGLDLAAALAGRAVARPGLLAEADGGLVVVPMAERLGAGVTALLGAALDTGETVGERDGASLRTRSRILVAALDDGAGDERVPAALAERLAFHCDLEDVGSPQPKPDASAGVVARPASVAPPAATVLGAIGATAAALGIDSARAALFALRAARASAALAGRGAIAEADVAIAARLVLAPRATRLPAEPEAPAPPPPPPDEAQADRAEEGDGGTLDDRVIAAARAALPADVLARIAADLAGRGTAQRARGAGERRRSFAHGRPLGVRAGKPGGGARLALVETLRAAAPWQRLRGRTLGDGGRIEIRAADLRIRRFEAVSEIVTIFAVDASGSAALARLAEAKGAVELLLGQAYVQRAEVALIAFRGTGAELLLPPTRSLARARRALAELPGGGGTPIAAGLTTAAEVARAAAARGRTPFLVILSDGRANIALDGSAGRTAADADALAAARAVAVAGTRALFIDTSPRPRPDAARLADAMRARYLALPRLDAGTVQAAVNAARPARG